MKFRSSLIDWKQSYFHTWQPLKYFVGFNSVNMFIEISSTHIVEFLLCTRQYTSHFKYFWGTQRWVITSTLKEFIIQECDKLNQIYSILSNYLAIKARHFCINNKTIEYDLYSYIFLPVCVQTRPEGGLGLLRWVDEGISWLQVIGCDLLNPPRRSAAIPWTGTFPSGNGKARCPQL